MSGQRFAPSLKPILYVEQALVEGVKATLADDSVYSFFVRQRPLADIAQITKSGVVICPAHLELSKLDSGLALLDLRPDDLRAAFSVSGEGMRALPMPTLVPGLIFVYAVLSRPI